MISFVPPVQYLERINLFLSKNLHITIYKISSNRESKHANNCENFPSTSKRAPVQFLRANRAKAKFCEHLKIVRDHLISLGSVAFSSTYLITNLVML